MIIQRLKQRIACSMNAVSKCLRTVHACIKEKSKPATAIVLSAAVLLSAIPTMGINTLSVNAQSNWDGTAAASFSQGGDGSQSSPYLIATEGELMLFANIVNGTGLDSTGFKQNNAAHATLTANIVLNEGDLSAYDGASANTWTQWTPIGNDLNRYTGTFNGNGYTVSGMYINNDSHHQGLFGYISKGGLLGNVGVVNSYIKGREMVGGICGMNDDGTIENCYNTGSVNANTTVGGISGYNVGTIKNCYNTGSVMVDMKIHNSQNYWTYGG